MDRSPFWKLSAELRNQIYDLASTNPGGVFIELIKDYAAKYEWRLKSRICQPYPLALTQVSKEMRREALGAFLAVNNVSLIVPMFGKTPLGKRPSPALCAKQVKRWLRGLHPIERGALKKIELDIGTWTTEGSRGHVKTKRLAAVLYSLATAFHADNVAVIVWLGFINVSQIYGLSRLPASRIPFSFKLSSVDVGALREVERAAYKSLVVRLFAEYDTSRLDRSYHSTHVYSVDCALKPLRQLGDALEELMKPGATEKVPQRSHRASGSHKAGQ